MSSSKAALDGTTALRVWKNVPAVGDIDRDHYIHPKIEYGRLYGELSWSGINSGIISSKRPKRPVPGRP